jgi:hypothetical protein
VPPGTSLWLEATINNRLVAEVQMNTENDCRYPGDNGGDSADEVAAPEKENENGCPDSAPSKSRTSELLKAMYYFVLSRL